MSNRPDWEEVRSALAGTLVTAAVVAGSRLGPEAGAAAGTLMQEWGLPLLGGALLGAGTFVRRRLWGWIAG